MTDTTAIAILPVHPDPAPADIPPATLTQARRLCAHARAASRRQTMGPNDAPTAVGAMVDEWARLAAAHATSLVFVGQPLAPELLGDLMAAVEQTRPAMRLSLACAVNTPPTMAPPPSEEISGSIVQMQWRFNGPPPAMDLLKSFAHAGIWNHLVLEGSSAAAVHRRTVRLQPNIVHSWTTHDDAPRPATDDAYGQVTPLPGCPLWRRIDDPVDRFLLVDRLGQGPMIRLRVADDGESLFTVGDRLVYHFVPPARLPEGALDEICAMVAAGGTVAATYVRSNLQRAHLVGYVTEHGVIVANSSLKNPRREYVAAVKDQTGLDLAGYLERGYTSVRPQYRGLGIGTRLLGGLTARAAGRRLFSVISEDNTATQIIARRNRTRKVATYFSAKAGKPVGIWMPEASIAADMKRGS